MHLAPFRLCLAFVLLLSGSAAMARDDATASVTVTDAGAQVSVELDHPTRRFRFAEADVVRDGVFRLTTPGLSLSGNTISAARPFRRFSYLIPPLSEEHDAKYPAFYRLGKGALIFGPALLGDTSDWDTHLLFPGRGSQTILPRANFEHGFIFLGPAGMVDSDTEADFVFDPATPQWLRNRVRDTVSASLHAYRDHLRLVLGEAPLVLVRHFPETGTGFVGDVSDNTVTALRFYGPEWNEETPGGTSRIRHFVLHEAFHFWNGGLASHSDDTPSWLHEGGAEYASILTSYLLGWSDDAAVDDRLSAALGKCREELGKRGEPALDSLDSLPAELRYSCGPLLQWFVDLHLRAQGKGRTVLDAWQDMLTEVVARDGTYTPDDFAHAAGLRDLSDLPAVDLLVNRSGSERWDRLYSLLNTMGAKVGLGSTGPNRSTTVMIHLLKSNCARVGKGGTYGFNGEPGRYRLETPEACGALAGNPVITGIEGELLDDLSETEFAAIARKCAASQPVELDKEKGGQIAAPCPPGLPTPPQQIVVKSWRPS